MASREAGALLALARGARDWASIKRELDKRGAGTSALARPDTREPPPDDGRLSSGRTLIVDIRNEPRRDEKSENAAAKKQTEEQDEEIPEPRESEREEQNQLVARQTPDEKNQDAINSNSIFLNGTGTQLEASSKRSSSSKVARTNQQLRNSIQTQGAHLKLPACKNRSQPVRAQIRGLQDLQRLPSFGSLPCKVSRPRPQTSEAKIGNLISESCTKNRVQVSSSQGAGQIKSTSNTSLERKYDKQEKKEPPVSAATGSGSPSLGSSVSLTSLVDTSGGEQPSSSSLSVALTESLASSSSPSILGKTSKLTAPSGIITTILPSSIRGRAKTVAAGETRSIPHQNSSLSDYGAAGKESPGGSAGRRRSATATRTSSSTTTTRTTTTIETKSKPPIGEPGRHRPFKLIGYSNISNLFPGKPMSLRDYPPVTTGANTTAAQARTRIDQRATTTTKREARELNQQQQQQRQQVTRRTARGLDSANQVRGAQRSSSELDLNRFGRQTDLSAGQFARANGQKAYPTRYFNPSGNRSRSTTRYNTNTAQTLTNDSRLRNRSLSSLISPLSQRPSYERHTSAVSSTSGYNSSLMGTIKRQGSGLLPAGGGGPGGKSRLAGTRPSSVAAVGGGGVTASVGRQRRSPSASSLYYGSAGASPYGEGSSGVGGSAGVGPGDADCPVHGYSPNGPPEMSGELGAFGASPVSPGGVARRTRPTAGRGTSWTRSSGQAGAREAAGEPAGAYYNSPGRFSVYSHSGNAEGGVRASLAPPGEQMRRILGTTPPATRPIYLHPQWAYSRPFIHLRGNRDFSELAGALDGAHNELEPIDGSPTGVGVPGGGLEFAPFSQLRDAQAIRSVDFHPSGEVYAIGSNSRALRICAYPAEHELRHFDPLERPPLAPRVLFKFLQVHRGSIYCVSFNATGQLLATGSNDQSVHIVRYNSATHSPDGDEFRLTMHDGTVRDLCFIDDHINGSSILLSAGGGDNKIYVTDCDTITPYQSMSGHSQMVMALRHWAGAQFVSCSLDRTIRFWDLRTRNCTSIVSAPPAHATPGAKSGGPGAPVCSLALDPSGRLLTSGHSDSTCMLYDIRGARVIKTFKPHDDEIRTISFSPKSYYLLTGGYDGRLVLTDLQGDLTQHLPSICVAECADKIVQAKWHPNDFTFVTTSADKTATLWALPAE